MHRSNRCRDLPRVLHVVVAAVAFDIGQADRERMQRPGSIPRQQRGVGARVVAAAQKRSDRAGDVAAGNRVVVERPHELDIEALLVRLGDRILEQIPVRFDADRAVGRANRGAPRLKLADVSKQRSRAGNARERQKVRQRRFIEGAGDVPVSEQRLDLGGEHDAGGGAPVVQRPHAKEVAAEHEAPRVRVPDRQRKLAVGATPSRDAFVFVQMEEQFARMRVRHRVTSVAQVRPQCTGVEDVAVADHHQRPVLVEDDAGARLADGGAQKAETERHRFNRPDPSCRVVRAAPLQRGSHRVQAYVDLSLAARFAGDSIDCRHGVMRPRATN